MVDSDPSLHKHLCTASRTGGWVLCSPGSWQTPPPSWRGSWSWPRSWWGCRGGPTRGASPPPPWSCTSPHSSSHVSLCSQLNTELNINYFCPNPLETMKCEWKSVKDAFKVVLTFLIYPVQLETRKTGSREETTRGTWPSFHPMLCQVTSTPVSASYQLNLLNFPQKSYKSIENLFNLSKLWSRSVSTFHYVNVDSGIE